MPRPVMFDSISAAQGAELVNKEFDSRESWIKMNKNAIWQQAMGPIQGRIQDICADKNELLRKLMDSQDEYFRFCKATPPPPPKVENPDTFIVRVAPDCADECSQDPTIPMKTPPESHTSILHGGGYKDYLETRYDSGLPETRFCYPPTTNSEYAWRLMETVRSLKCSTRPRLATVGPAFYRSRGVMCKPDCAPYHFPRIYG